MSHDSSFGQVVRQHRRSLDLTQEELARRVGCAAITLRKVEAGDLRPSQQIAERLAMALAVPLDERADFVRQARSVQPGGQPIEPTPTPQVMPEEIGLEDLSGRAIRGYQLGEKIGAGSFGAVYRGVQPLVEREVAIKIILPQYANHPDFIRRFEAEAQLVARLEHPHIVSLYDYWREPGVAYLVMRLLRGGSIHDLIEHGPLPLDQAARLLVQMCAALQAAHRAGVVHRDLKPSNVLLDEDHNAYLADFGIAKNLGSPDDHTQTGMIIGSPAYISPEQINTEPVRPQTDIYSLGVMVYEMLTGAKPFTGPRPSCSFSSICSSPCRRWPPIVKACPPLSTPLSRAPRRKIRCSVITKSMRCWPISKKC
jgi:serine/threonine protein kinase/DNA-binding XRE family transcriptional regulator